MQKLANDPVVMQKLGNDPVVMQGGKKGQGRGWSPENGSKPVPD